jgi:hypothetical protein
LAYDGFGNPTVSQGFQMVRIFCAVIKISSCLRRRLR